MGLFSRPTSRRHMLSATTMALFATACSHNDRLYPFEAGPLEVEDPDTGAPILIAGEECYRNSEAGIDLHVVASNRDGDLRSAYEPDCSLNSKHHFRNVMANWASYAGRAPQGETDEAHAWNGRFSSIRSLMIDPPCPDPTGATGAEKPVHKLLIYVHGGRVSHEKGVARAELRTPEILCDSNKEDRHFPIFFVYETTDLNAYFEQVVWIRDGEKKRKPVIEQVPYKLFSDLGSGIFRAPYSLLREGDRAAALRFGPAFGRGDNDYYVNDHDKKNKFDIYYDYEHRFGGERCDAFSDCNVLYPAPGVWGKEDANPNKRATNFGVALSPILAIPKALIGTPFVNGAGPTAWGNIRRRALNTANRPSEFSRDQQYDQQYFDPEDLDAAQAWPWLYEKTTEEMEEYSRGTGAFARFLHDLERCFQWRNGTLPSDTASNFGADLCGPMFKPETRDAFSIEVDFVAHSTGAIVLDNLLPRYRDIETASIVYMASAASIRETAFSISPLLTPRRSSDAPQTEKHPSQEAVTHALPVFYNLMLHPKAETLDQYAWGLVPEGSLLEWIDEFLGDSRTIDLKTMGKWRNVRDAKRIFPPIAQERMLFRVFPANNREKDMHKNAACLYFGNGSGPNAISRRGYFKKNNKKATGRCYPLTHGEFENFAYWRREFWRGADPIPPEIKHSSFSAAEFRIDANSAAKIHPSD